MNLEPQSQIRLREWVMNKLSYCTQRLFLILSGTHLLHDGFFKSICSGNTTERNILNPIYFTYEYFLWAFEGEVIIEVANFKEEDLVTWKEKKEKRVLFWDFVHAGSWTLVACVKGKSVNHYTIWTLVSDEIDCNK